MAKNEIHVGDIGTKFEATFKDDTTVVDISAATTKELIFRFPGADAAAKAGTFSTDGTDGKLYYLTVASDLASKGTLRVQGHIITPGGEWYSDIKEYEVHANLL
ncbi:MAG: hypothetical protein ACYS7Y_27035 [Planctomycetota bacterium]|jgi:hypothetical protein